MLITVITLWWLPELGVRQLFNVATTRLRIAASVIFSKTCRRCYLAPFMSSFVRQSIVLHNFLSNKGRSGRFYIEYQIYPVALIDNKLLNVLYLNTQSS